MPKPARQAHKGQPHPRIMLDQHMNMAFALSLTRTTGCNPAFTRVACPPSIPPPRLAWVIHHRRNTLRACASTDAVVSYEDSVKLAESGDFHGAARALRIPSSTDLDPEERRKIARLLLNPISIHRLKSGADSGIVELYETMKAKGLLRAFASVPLALSSPSASDKAVSVEKLVTQAGLPLSALAPKPSTIWLWRVSGIAAALSIVAGLRSIGEESLASPLLLSLGCLFFLDQTYLRGILFEQVYGRLNPEYSSRIAHHEAGHLLCGYLSGMSISGYVLSGGEALKGGIPSQAGTLFYDSRMSRELADGQVTNRTIDRYTCVLMAGIAAEAIEYGQAEGGGGDEAALISLLTQVRPPWSPTAIKAQARWAVLQAILILRRNMQAYEALYEAMKARKPLGDCIDVIERLAVPPADHARAKAPANIDESKLVELRQIELKEREEQVLAELQRVRERLSELEQRRTDKS